MYSFSLSGNTSMSEHFIPLRIVERTNCLAIDKHTRTRILSNEGSALMKGHLNKKIEMSNASVALLRNTLHMCSLFFDSTTCTPNAPAANFTR